MSNLEKWRLVASLTAEAETTLAEVEALAGTLSAMHEPFKLAIRELRPLVAQAAAAASAASAVHALSALGGRFDDGLLEQLRR